MCVCFVYAEGSDPPVRPPDGFVFVANIPYGVVSGAQRLDILYPPNAKHPLPAIINIHGGGWYAGGKGGETTLAMLCRFAESGFVALSIDYRLSDEATFPAAVEDCKQAVRWLRAHATDYNVDPERIGVIGASAGGHLSAMLAVTRPEDEFDRAGRYLEYSSAVQAAAPVCGPMDLCVPLAPQRYPDNDPAVVRFLGGTFPGKLGAARRASPITYVRKELPPILLVHGDADNRVELSQSQKFADALAAAGAPHELLVVKGGGHGMGIARDDAMLARIVAFFRAHLGATPLRTARTRGEALCEWQDAKFGMFIHWGPSSLTGEEISWARGGVRPGLPELRQGTIPIEEYDRIYERFDPVDFDAREWVTIAQDAGMNYLVFTTKHHDGFSMFDTKLSDYSIMRAPFKRDIVAELADACHETGFGLGLYYSLPDWHHPDYLTTTHQRYRDYLHGQLRELCSNYGRVDVIWFDGKNQGTAKTWGSPQLVKTIRELQPQVLINDRVHGDTDFHTPEQVIGRFDLDNPWESCVTLGQQWSWKPNDDIKSWQECVQLLARAVGGGGNLMLNVGPMPSGTIEPRQVAVLEQIGDWLDRYGESIYGTRGGPFAPSYWGASTRMGNVIFLHIFEGWDTTLELPPIDRGIVSARSLNGGLIEVSQSPEGIIVTVPDNARFSPDTVIALTLDGPAGDIEPISSGMVMPRGTTASAPNVRRNEANFTPDKAVDDSPLSRWATDDGITETWLEIQFPKPVTFDVIAIDEAFGLRVQQFELQAREGDDWKTFYSGATIGRNWAAKFPPVTTREVRIDILKAADGPTFRDILFHVLPSE
jgi:alpha-L-fucosidase